MAELDELLVEPVVEQAPAKVALPRGNPLMERLGDIFTEEQVVDNLAMEDEANEPLGEGNWLNGPAAPLYSIGRSFQHGDNIGVNIGKEIFRKVTTGPSDPAWRGGGYQAWIEQNANDIAPDQAWRYAGTRNSAEATALLADAKADQRAMQINQMRGGFEQFTAAAIAGLVDIDAPLAFFSGGLTAGAKLGITATKAGRVLAGATGGALAGASLGTIDYAVNPNSDPESIVLFAAFGAGFGLFGGAAGKAGVVEANATSRRDLVNEAGENVQFGLPPERMEPNELPIDMDVIRKPVAVATGDVTPDTTLDGDLWSPNSTAGARQATTTKVYDGPGINDVKSPEIKSLILDSHQWQRQSSEVADWEDPTAAIGAGLKEPSVRAAIRMRDYLAKVGLSTDFDNLYRSNLATARRFATLFLESPSQIAGGKTNASVLKEVYGTQMRKSLEPYEPAYRDWFAKEQGYTNNQFLQTPLGQGVWNAREQFDREILLELNARLHGRGTRTSSPSVKKAADALDEFWRREHSIGKGRDGQKPVQGYDQFEWKSGYSPYMWSGQKMADMLAAASKTGGATAKKAKLKQMVNFLDNQYAKMSPAWDPKQRKAAAAAVIDRALASRRGLQRDLIALLSGDESEFIRAALRRQAGMTDLEIDKVLESIVGSRTAKSQPGQTRHRQDVDLEAVDPSGLSVMDMMETDVGRMANRRMHSTAGMAGLARMGIGSKVDFELWKKAILEEQRVRGKKNPRTAPSGAAVQDKAMDKVDDFVDNEYEISADTLDAMYGYFTGIRPNAGAGYDAVVQRMKKVAQLSLMNQLGVTSLADHGVTAGAVGWKRWWKHMSQDLKDQFGKSDSPLMQELRTFNFFSPEETMFNHRFLQELDRAEDDMWSKADVALNKAVEFQGWWSGFNMARRNLQRVALTSMTSKLYESVHKGVAEFTPARLRSIGLDPQFMARTMKNAAYDADGNLTALNMHSWDPDDVETFQIAMARSMNQLSQKALAGESNWAFQKTGLMSLFMQLKSYPLTAINKQTIRNMRLADKESMQTFMYGLIVGGAVFAAKGAINGTIYDPGQIARGAMNYSNMVGWMPMVVDPVLDAVGVDASMSGYSSRGAGGIISLPAAYSVADRLAGTIGAVTDSLDGNPSNSSIRTLQTLPLLGNSYGINAWLNSMKE